MSDPFSTYVKPQLGRILSCIGLDVEYVRAEGNTLYYRDEDGGEKPVLDLLGGYGSLIFGHNHPDIVARAREMLDAGIAVHAQVSTRGQAGRVGEALNAILRREIAAEEPYLATFANSGAEAVEAALKHAELDRVMKVADLLDEITVNIETVRTALRRGEAAVPSDIYEFSDIREQVFDVRDFDELVVGLINHNTAQLTKRPVFLALEKSFHGKLIGSLQLTYNKNFRRPFQYFGMKTRFVPMNRPEVLDRIAADERATLFDLAVEDGRVRIVERELPLICAFIVEPVQGEGGINAVTKEFGRAIRRFCNETGCPLIIDEIQSGMGRCGAFLASSLIGLRGDYYTFSKSLGGGVAKISAMLVRKSIYRKEFSLLHTSTYADDDYSCGIALKVLQMLEADGGMAYGHAVERGSRLTAMLEELKAEFPDIIRDVRGRGLFIGIELNPQNDASSMILRGAAYNEFLGYMLAGYMLRVEGIRILPTGSAPNVLRLEPSILISDAEIERFRLALARACRFLRHQDALHLVHPMSDRKLPRPRDDIRDFREVQVLERADAGRAGERPVTRPVRKVAFINHLISPEWLRQVDPSLADMSDAALRAFVMRMDPMKKTAPYPPVRIHSPLGSAVDFILYPLCASSEQMGNYLAAGDFAPIREDIDERIRAAREDGCEIAGLGMYTSIVTNNCTAIRIPHMPLTSGNALTVAMGMQAMETAAKSRFGGLDDLSLVVVGAAGNIASTYCALFAEHLPRLVLVGSRRDGSAPRLRKTAHNIYQECWSQIAAGGELRGIPGHLRDEFLILNWLRDGRPANQPSGRAIAEYLDQRYGTDPFLTVSDSLDDVRGGHLVLCAANSPVPILNGQNFADNAIVCDIAVPNNVVSNIQRERPDILYMQGGIVATPNGESLHVGARAFLGEGQLFACMAETAVLGLAGFKDHYSHGSISRQQVHEIAGLAAAHGFRLADYKTSHSL